MSFPALRQPRIKQITQEKSIPALRKPYSKQKVKSNENEQKQQENLNNNELGEIDYVFVTLKNKIQMVVSSDFYNGIHKTATRFKCVFCNTNMELILKAKKCHKLSESHKRNVAKYPHVMEFSENLIRKIDNGNFYCTICGVIVEFQHLNRHIISEVHKYEVYKAISRASSYKPASIKGPISSPT